MLINAYATHRDPPALEFPHQLHGRRDRSDPELDGHLQGFMGYVMDGGKRRMSQMRYAVLRHLQRVHHHLSLEVEGAQMPAFEDWARAANAIVFLPDGSVRAPDGRMLVAPDTGEHEPGAEVPYPADAVARKTATEAALAARTIRVPPTLPPGIAATEVELRAPGEVAERMLGLFACALRAESIATNHPIPADEIAERMPVAVAALTPSEAAFLRAETPPQQDVVNHAWRYECVAVLAWALGRAELPFPAAICDVPGLARTVYELDAAAFVATAQLRPAAEILDALDLTFRLHWATTDARANRGPSPEGVDPGVVAERHHALNWLTRFEDAAWDDVTTPT